MKYIIIKAVVLCAAAFAGISAQAQTVYVTDHLAVGIHETESPNSAIIEVLPTGTVLEILEDGENFVRVRNDEGLGGWVDKNYLMIEKPSQLALLELETQHIDTLNALEIAKEEIEALTLTAESLRAAGQLQGNTEEATSDALSEMQRLAKENQILKQELDSTKAIAATAQSIQEVIVTPGTDSQLTMPSSSRPSLTLWHWIVVFVLMALSFGLGAYLVDWSMRRRHGGFRV